MGSSGAGGSSNGTSGSQGSGGVSGSSGSSGVVPDAGSSGGLSGSSGAGSSGSTVEVDAGGNSGSGGTDASADASVPEGDAATALLTDGGLGGPSLCAAHAYAVCEDFEGTAVGATPTGWTVPTSNYGTATLGVASDFAARGAHSWKVSVDSTASTEKYLQRGNLGALANAHYGRLFFRVQSPTVTTFIHWDLVLGAGQLMNGGGARRIRWGSTGSNGGLPSSGWHWIYNIEQGDTGVEDSQAGHPVPGVDAWMCVEWLWDGTNQAADFYFQGVERPALHIGKTLPNGKTSDIPIFTSLNFGIAEYQGTNNTPLVFWIDEIALDTQRIGCGG
jgi:hypothetical protein